MNNDKRIALSLAMIAIIAVAAIGVGYAYTAITSNTNNSASVEYIALQQVADGTSEGQYNFADSTSDTVIWNTNDYYDGTNYKTEYRLDGTTIKTYDEDYILEPIGKSFKVTATPQSGGTALEGGLTCKISTVNFDTPTISGATIEGGNLYFFVEVNNNSVPTTFRVSNDVVESYNGSSWVSADTFNIAKHEASTYYDTTVKIYCALPASNDHITISNTNNTPRLLAGKVLNDASIMFSASTESSVVTGVSIDGEDVINISKETGSGTLTAVVTGGSNQAIYWTSGTIEKATVISATATTATVTLTNAAAVGDEIIITVHTVDGQLTASKTIKVVA